MRQMGIKIEQYEPGIDLEEFMQMPFGVYSGDPVWVAPLDIKMKGRLTPEKYPFFQRAEVALLKA